MEKIMYFVDASPFKMKDKEKNVEIVFYKAVILTEYGYEVCKISKECFEAVMAKNRHRNKISNIFYDKFGRIIKIEF